MKKRIAFILAFILLLTDGGMHVMATPGEFDCNSISDIPVAECTALTDLYKDTSGDGWNNKDGWLSDTVADNWYGVSVSSGNVTVLNLHNNNLNGTLPSSIGNLDHLIQLALSYNYISGNIPPSLENMSKLTVLNLYSNQLKGSIPAELGNLTNLEYLYLYLNQLEGPIPYQLGNLVALKWICIITS